MRLSRRPRVIAGNRIALLKNGAEFFPALVEAIEGAVSEVRIETYIFCNDVAGINIAEALKRAAQRGVKVYLLIDGVGSHTTPEAFFADLHGAGVEVLVFRPEKRVFNFRKSRLRRVHRKIGLIDGRIGFVGGINLIDDMTDSLSDSPRYDYAVRVEGPLLGDIHRELLHLWRVVSWWKFGRRVSLVPLLQSASQQLPVAAGNTKAMFAVRDNLRHRRDIEKAYLVAIGNAHREVLITSPYFLPGRHFRRALIEATERGVRVTLLLQGRADHMLLQQATRALYTQLLGAGVAIFEYHRSMLHGKVAVVDDTWATVGSSNLDPFSLFLNREANVMVHDATFAKTLRASVMEEIEANATKLDPMNWKKRGWRDRMSTWIAYGFARWVTGWLGFAKRWE
ncbi:MAG: cardiolipin synthase ClsB [Usitatibacteraceae bacterium]